jgi:hypothetical protein
MKQASGGVCVLGVSTETLDLPGVLLTTGNAGSPLSRQARWNEGQALQFLDREEVFADSWKDEDGNDLKRIKIAMCAEILIPDKVEPLFITRILVPTAGIANHPNLHGLSRPVIIDEHLFFSSRPREVP